MVDPRFFNKQEFVTLKRICELLDINLPDTCSPVKHIRDIARIDSANQDEITFFHNTKYLEALKKTNAFACVIAKEYANYVPETTIALIVDEPYLAHAILLREFYSLKGTGKNENGKTYISDRASVSKSAKIGDGSYICDFAVIEDNVVLGKNTYVGSNTTIQTGVVIGDDSHIEPNVTIGFAEIGQRAYIKAGARIGQQGFGFHVGKTGITDVMQIGKVKIGDDVQIGANSAIDRGSMGDTKVGSHSRIDNFVYLAHNVELGEFCVFAGQTGLAGSVRVGDGCFMGGQVGIAGHIEIGDRVTIAAQSGVMQNVPSNSRIAGTPATNVINWHRQTVALRKLVEMRDLFYKRAGIVRRFINWIKKLFS